jgi:hypothetical protein
LKLQWASVVPRGGASYMNQKNISSCAAWDETSLIGTEWKHFLESTIDRLSWLMRMMSIKFTRLVR